MPVQKGPNTGVGPVGGAGGQHAAVAGHGEAVRLQLAQLPEQLIQGDATDKAAEPAYRAQVALLNRQAFQHIAHQGLEINLGRLVPEGVIPGEHRRNDGGQGDDILLVVLPAPAVVPDGRQGVIAPGVPVHPGKVQLHDLVASGLQVGLELLAEIALGVGDHQTALGLEDIGNHISPGLSGP